MILQDKNFILVKFGDGEMRNMISKDENEHNCDNNNYFKELGLDLIRSYIYYLRNNNTYINKWHSHVYEIQDLIEKDNKQYYDHEIKFVFYDLLIHKLPFRPDLVNFFRSIKTSI